MIFPKLRAALLAGSAIGLAGCATVPRDAGFGQVRREVAQRSGRQIEWQNVSSDAARTNQAIEAMLKAPLSARDAVEIALLNNRELQASYEDLGIAQADLVQAGLLSNPTLSLERRFPGQAAEIDIAQSFLDVLLIPLRKKVAAADFAAARMRTGHRVMNLSAEVSEAYYTLQANEQLLDELKRSVELDQAAAGLAGKQHQAGTLNELDTTARQLVYEQAQADVARTRGELASQREALNRLMGLWGSQVHWTIQPDLPELPSSDVASATSRPTSRPAADPASGEASDNAPPQTSDATSPPASRRLEELALQQRMDLSARRAKIESAARQLGIVDVTRCIPVLVVAGHYEHEDSPGHSLGPAVEIGVPLFDQGQAHKARAQALLRQAQQRYTSLAIDIRSEVRQSLQQMSIQRELVNRYGAMLPARHRITQLTLEQYNGMLKGPYDLLAARQDEVRTRQAYLEALRDYWIARTELERAIGGRLESK
jgi:cobalt-zinc-cadmium efflux system outer membrane protein